MEVKKFWINDKEWTSVLKRILEKCYSIKLNNKKTLTVSFISSNQETKTILFKVDDKLYKAKIIHTPTTSNPFFELYLLHSKETICIKTKSQKQTLNRNEIQKETFRSELQSPLSGKIVTVHVKPKQKVDKNQPLVTIESMKMENIICAKANVFIKTISILEGDLVQPKQILMTFAKRGEVYATSKNSDVKKTI